MSETVQKTIIYAPETKVTQTLTSGTEIGTVNGTPLYAPDSTQGEQGEPGAAATVTVGTVTTGDAGTAASVTNSGTENAAVLDFIIPRGDTGATGETGAAGATGADGAAATVTVGTVTTGDAGTAASVTNSGTENAAVLDFVIPRGDTGATGETGAAGSDATVTVTQTLTSGTEIGTVNGTALYAPEASSGSSLGSYYDTTSSNANRVIAGHFEGDSNTIISNCPTECRITITNDDFYNSVSTLTAGSYARFSYQKYVSTFYINNLSLTQSSGDVTIIMPVILTIKNSSGSSIYLKGIAPIEFNTTYGVSIARSSEPGSFLAVMQSTTDAKLYKIEIDSAARYTISTLSGRFFGNVSFQYGDNDTGNGTSCYVVRLI